MAWTVWNGSATVAGTGRSRRISRCRHFALPPCVVADIATSVVIGVSVWNPACFCIAASPPSQGQHSVTAA